MHALTALRAAAVVALVLAAGGCSRFSVQADADPNVDFARFATFAWMPPDEAPPMDQRLQDRAIERRVQSGVEAGLRARGYQPATGGTPDLWVTYRLISESRSSRGIPAGYGGYQLGWWAGGRIQRTENYERGTLIVDVIDAKDDELVWRGSASARLLPHISFEKRAKRATEAVEKIMADFPAR
jgi:hypothetical protein